MMYRSHLLWGGMSASLVWPHVGQWDDWQRGVWFFGAACIGALLPDVDHPKSKIGRMLPGISHGIHWLFRHRGATHSLLATFIVSSLVSLWSVEAGLGMLTGYLTHLACDFWTDGGIPLLWPHKRRLGWKVFHTGSVAETWVNVLGIVVFFAAIDFWKLLIPWWTVFSSFVKNFV